MGASNKGEGQTFTLSYTFFTETHETKIAMMVNGENTLSFTRDDQQLTARWNLDEFVFWLRDFLDHAKEDPYPVEVDGYIEISWNNQEPEEGVKFSHELGGVRIVAEHFVEEVDSFLNAYANQWF